MTNNTTLSNGCEATYPYFEKESTNGIIPLNNFPNLKFSTHPLSKRTTTVLQRLSPDISGFWIDYFSNNPPAIIRTHSELVELISMSMKTVTKIAETLFPFTIGGDKQAVLDIGARFPVFNSFATDGSSIEQMEVFDPNNDINLEHFVPIEWIQYELAVHGFSSNWLHHWVYNLDDTYQSGKLLKFGVVINEKNDVLAYDYLNKHIFLRVLLQRWLYTFVMSYIDAIAEPLRDVKDVSVSRGGLETTGVELKIVNFIIGQRQELSRLITYMSNFWIFKSDDRSEYGTFVQNVKRLHQEAVLSSVR